MSEPETVSLISQIAPFSSLLAALVASGSALWIAYRVYPWQKEKDRALELQRENRKVYREFMKEWGQVWSVINAAEKRAKDDPMKAVEEYASALRLADASLIPLAMSSSQKTLNCAAGMHASLYKAYGGFGETISDNTDENGNVSNPKVYALFKANISALRDQDRKGVSTLVNLMRSDEFDAVGQIDFLKPSTIATGKSDEATK